MENIHTVNQQMANERDSMEEGIVHHAQCKVTDLVIARLSAGFNEGISTRRASQE